MSGFSHHDLLVAFFDGTLSKKAIVQIENILFTSGGSATPFQEAIELRSANVHLVRALKSAHEVFNNQHNLLSTATDAECRAVVENVIYWWNIVALPILHKYVLKGEANG